ncbi:unnamed protein product [Moneuplotes crassus]|uniref:Insertion element IS150 protein InsJ-like helix-turn-helix domain-containing protein n=1 Tax=Euplotes crassus TaxID=5936 RepID=A0AAD1XRB4_EUPCR|nr:unnamed protein product [Moneuplotes crassus]
MNMSSPLLFQNPLMYYPRPLPNQRFMAGVVPTEDLIQVDRKPRNKRTKRSYVQCNLTKRQSLVQRVERDGLTIKEAAIELKINYSTAKHIIKVFRQSGEVETKIMMKRKNKNPNLKNSSYSSTGPSNYVNTSPVIKNTHVGTTTVNSNLSLPCALNLDLTVTPNMKYEFFVPSKITDQEKCELSDFFFR